MQTNNSKLHEIMDEHSLVRKQVAKMTYASKSAVDRWMVPENIEENGIIIPNPSSNKMPDHRFELLLIGVEKLDKE